MSKKEITHKDILGGKLELQPLKDGGEDHYEPRDYDAARDIEKFGLLAVEEVEIVNPITAEKNLVTIRRDGTTESKVIQVLADPNSSRELKDSVLSMYLFERGKESSSFLLDLWASKGQHTKETRVFKAQVRRDVDIIVETLILLMRDAAERIIDGVPFIIEKTKDNKYTLKPTFIPTDVDKLGKTLAELAIFFQETGDLMHARLKEETIRREREKGKGIYVSPNGKTYDIFEDQTEIVTQMQEDIKNIKPE